MKRILLAGAAGLVLSISAGGGLGATAFADQVFADDVIIQMSLCVGRDCVNGEDFGFDTVRLKENNLRVHFDDTSTSSSYPANDWTLIANDSVSGGANYFAIEDRTAGRQIFKVLAGAPSNSLYIASTGRVGLRTTTPVLDLHISTSNTPGMRLEQTSSGGFPAQTWDIAGNEANFFIRDVTNGSRLPFRIRPGAPSSSIDIAADGDVFFGAAASSTNSGDVVIGKTDDSTVRQLDIASSTATQLRFVGATENRRIVARDSDGSANETQIILRSNNIALVGATDVNDTWATFKGGGVDIGSASDSTVRLVQLASSTAAQYRLIGNTENRRIVAMDSAGSLPDTQMLLKNNSIVFAGPTDANDTWATIDANGLTTTGGGACDPNPCDGVFDPELFRPLSIEDHAASMWENSFLPGVGPTPEGAPINITRKVTGILHELEVAHIYIEQLNSRISERDEAIEQLNSRLAQLESRLAQPDGEL